MSNNLRMLPGRWFAPRDAAFCVNSPSGMPLRDEIDRIFQGLFNGMVSPWGESGRLLPANSDGREQPLTPRLDMTSDDAAYLLRIELPGVEADKVNVAVQDKELVISGEKQRETEEKNTDQYIRERVFGSFQRMLTLPDDADVEAITAAYKNGVLSVTVPRKALAESMSKKIDIVRE
ncbi:Hsp20/alpha crystallin family protein [Desulfovibrio desulfuricans]|uniref:Hsp20/alpha crystallin family protein n=1 Tax=Desulfovibrio desulfuricans TaxID=876 RepID=A0A4P7UEZ6_DESDE|nr:Hsp20/alpha crystallin family protein [Desulfovibrio desulfuricans]QCC84393.1 Hsp20/alpha crystallin family protein [Desulfovibrio desulfuricans]